tara:strand:- start:4943 stop:5725 length:783 start_codon:yes stop_codon:yes gene_type:complete
MVKILINLKKSVEENASVYYEKAKKAKKKIKGAEDAIKKNKKKLIDLQKKADKELKEIEEKEEVVKRRKEWYEKFRWFFTSEGFLVIGGRDATSNEVVIKKYTESNDLVFHTDMAGSPFFVVKTDGKDVGGASKNEVSDATCTFSRAWKLGLQTTSVFSVDPEQVSKKAQSGEYLTKGAFMIYGKVNYVDNTVNLAVGDYKGKIMAGPVESVKKHCKKVIILVQGDEKPSDIAKKIKHKLGGDLDTIIRALPAGEFSIKE